MTAGATPQDWQHFTELGLTADLLPVVSDTSLPISPRSRMKDAGKTPSVVNGEGHIVGLSKWTEQHTKPAQVRAWSKDSRLGICVQTRVVRAFDVDIADPAISAEVRDLVEMLAGPLPCRSRPNSGKLLLVFRMEGTFPKQRIITDTGMIEFLANGQQFIAVGTHPSGVRYEWDGLGDTIPTLTPDEFTTIWQGLALTYGVAPAESTERAVTSHDSPVVGLTEADARALLAVLDPAMGYDDWLKVGQALHHESRGAWLHLWIEWSAQGEYPGDDVLEYKWAGFGRNSGAAVTAGTLIHMAKAGTGGVGVQLSINAPAAPDEFPVVEAATSDSGEPMDLPPYQRNNKGVIEVNITNAVLALRRADICGSRIAYDEFKDSTLVAYGQAWRPLRDTDYTRMRVALEANGFKKPSRELVRDAAMQVAEENTFDSALQWAESLRWDGVPRVERFLHDYASAEPGAYTSAVSRYIWTALAARLIQPGAKCDMVPVLVGGQGTGKSTGVAAMAPEPDAYVEVNLEHRDDNLARSLRGKLVGELGELRGLMSRDAEAIKAWITRTHEEWIPKYVEFATKFPRRLVFIGTTNSDEFLADDTGERRWLPVRVGAVDVEAITRDRDQLWAEGVELFKREGLHWRDAMELAKDKHDEFKVNDAWAVPVRQWLLNDEMDTPDGTPRGMFPFKIESVMSGALRLDAKHHGVREQKRVASILKALGFAKRRATRTEGGKHTWEPGENCMLFELA